MELQQVLENLISLYRHHCDKLLVNYLLALINKSLSHLQHACSAQLLISVRDNRRVVLNASQFKHLHRMLWCILARKTVINNAQSLVVEITSYTYFTRHYGIMM